MNFLDSLLDDSSHLGSSILPTHLDAPIKDHMIKLLLNRIPLDCRWPRWKKKTVEVGKKHLRYLCEIHGLPYLRTDHVREGFAHLHRQLYHIKKPEQFEETTHSLTESIRASKILFELQLKSMGLDSHLPSNNALLQCIESIHYAKELFQQAVLLSGSQSTRLKGPLWNFSKEMRMWFWKHDNIAIYFDREWVFIFKNREVSVGIREHLLQLSDILGQREILLQHSRVAQHYHDPTVPSIDQLNHIFSWGDTILEKYGNKGYELLSSWESLCLGSLQSSQEDPYWNNNLFLEKMKEDFNQWEGLERDDRCDEIVNFLKELSSLNPNLLTQVFGLYRIWGHPTVNAAGGIAKLKQHACKIKPLNWQMINRVSCVFKERFCFDYRRQHGKWPELDLSKLKEHTFLKEQLARNGNINKKDPRYSLLSWSKVKAEKTFEILPKYNLVKLLSDKAMSLGIQDLKEEVKKGSIGPAWKRSVLIKWLESQIGDPIIFLKDICSNGFGDEEKVVGVCPKERELKLWARMFGLLTLKKRMYVVLTEAMLAEHIIPYFPEITMLDSSTTLLKKMYHSTKSSSPHRVKSMIDLYTSMDFQKWNSNMREEETKEIFEFLDGLFGLSQCFSRTHEMFSTAQLYLADGTYLPQIGQNGLLIEDEYCWSNHLGGIEGLRQKGWTIFTVCIIRFGMEHHDSEFQLMGQGDNQVLKVSYPNNLSSHEITKLHQKLMESLGTLFAQIGPSIKPSESWTSSNLFIYGKFPIFMGCPLSMSMKKMCRMFPFSNEGFPTLESSISSISANLMAACNQAIRLEGIFFSYLIQCFECLKLHLFVNYLTDFFIKPNDDLYFRVPLRDKSSLKIPLEDTRPLILSLMRNNHHHLSAILLMPRCLGGYPISLFGSLFSNGFPDPVSESIALLKKMYGKGEWDAEIQCILSVNLHTEVSSELICEDPVAINMLHPSSPKEVLKRLVQEYLGSVTWIKNKEFLPFIKLAIERQRPLCDHLLKIRPFNPRIAHAIQEATLIGRAIQVVGQLEKTNTLIRMMQMQAGDNVLKSLIKSDKNYFLSVCFNLNTRGENWNEQICSRQWSQFLRDKGWQTQVEGVTVAPIQEAFGPELLLNDECKNHQNRDLGYFLCLPDEGRLQTWRANTDLGPHDPYIGSQTVEKTQSYGKDLARDTQPILRNAAKLLTLINWGTLEGSNLANLIMSLFLSLSDIDPNLLIPVAGQIAGSVGHRFLDSATKHGGTISILYSMASHFHLSSNTLSAYKSGAQNVNLHFQALMGISLVWSSLLILSGKIPPRTLHYHIQCSSCIIPINEEHLDIEPHPNISSLFPSLPNNPICWVSKTSLQDKFDLSECLDTPIILAPDHPNIFSAFHQRLAQQCAKWIRDMTFEQGDNRKLGTTTFSLNMSWIGKINLLEFIDNFLQYIGSMILYNMDHSQIRSIQSKDELITTIMHHIEQRPKQTFNWCANLYSNPLLMDQMKSSFGGVPLPATVPLSHYDSTSHFTKMLLWRLSEWSLLDNIFEEVPLLFFSESSREIDAHPVFRFYFVLILRGTNQEIFDSITGFLLWKQVFQLTGLSYGNHFNLIQCTRAIMVFQKAGELHHMNIVKELQKTKQAKFIWIQNHIDVLSKSVQPTELHYYPHPLYLTNEIKLSISQMSKIWRGDVFPLSKDNILLFPPAFNTPSDRQVHEYRLVRNPTSSWYKLISCLSYLDPPHETVVCLADGSAGFSFLLSRFLDVTQVYYNTLYRSSQAMDQMGPNFIPSSFIGFPELRSKLISLTDLTENISDILHVGFSSQLLHRLKGMKISLLTCDAEGPSSFDPYHEISILQRCCDLSYHLQVQQVLLKFYGSSPQHIRAASMIVGSVYQEYTVIRSLYSNQENLELYILGKQLRECPLTLTLNKNSDLIASISGYGLSRRSGDIIFQMLTELPTLKGPDFKTSLQLCNKILQDPWTEIYQKGQLRLWFGIRSDLKENYTFPHDLIKYHQIGVSPIRMKRISRRRGMVNLIKFQRCKLWALSWISMLRRLHKIKIEDYILTTNLIIVKSLRGWVFYLTESKQISHPCSKIYPLTKLISISDISSCYWVSGLLYHSNINIKDESVRFRKWVSFNSTDKAKPL